MYERARYIHALKAVSKFFNKLGASRSYGKRFYRLALALDDLNHGTVDPLLNEVKTGGTKKFNASWAWCARAQVSLGIFALQKAGLTRAAAAKEAARKFSDIEGLAALSRQKPSSTETKILSWFDDFNKDRSKSKIKNGQALAIFASGRQDIERLPQDDSAELRQVANRMFASALERRFGIDPAYIPKRSMLLSSSGE